MSVSVSIRLHIDLPATWRQNGSCPSFSLEPMPAAYRLSGDDLAYPEHYGYYIYRPDLAPLSPYPVYYKSGDTSSSSSVAFNREESCVVWKAGLTSRKQPTCAPICLLASFSDVTFLACPCYS